MQLAFAVRQGQMVLQGSDGVRFLEPLGDVLSDVGEALVAARKEKAVQSARL